MKPVARHYHTIFNLVVLSIVIYVGVGVFYRVVGERLRQVNTQTFVVEQQATTDKGRQKLPLNDYRSIIDRNLFGSTDQASEEVKAEEIDTLEPTSLKIALLGTVTGNPQNAVAVIEETAKKKQGLYKVGDSVDNAIIKMILREKVVLRVDDRDEVLTMEEAAARRTEKEPQASRPRKRGTTITVSRSDIARSLQDMNKLLSEVRIRPHFKNGKPDGLALSRIKGGSIFSKLGLRNGDIVQGMNDSSIESPDDILELYNQLKSGSEVELQIERKGQTQNMNYRFR